MTLRHRQENVDVVQIRTYQQVVDLINNLHRNPGYYKAVGLDSVTELQKLDMRTVMKERFDSNPDKTDIYVPDQRAWGKSSERVRVTIRAFIDLPMHTFVTCLLATETNEHNNKKLHFPSLPGKLKGEVAGFFDIVGLLQAKTEKGEDDETVIRRTLQVVKTDTAIAKDRSGSLGSIVKEPSIPLIWDMINGNNNTNTNNGEKG